MTKPTPNKITPAAAKPSLLNAVKRQVYFLIYPERKREAAKQQADLKARKAAKAAKAAKLAAKAAKAANLQQPTNLETRVAAPLTPQDKMELLKVQARKNKIAVKMLQMMADRHDNFSLSPGVADWRQKWETTKGKRVLMFAYVDYSSSFYKWTDAVNRFSPHAARMATVNLHRFGYPVDLLYPPAPLLTENFLPSYNELLELADQADIIHIKDQTGFLDGRNTLPAHLFKQFGKPIIYTLYGGTARHDQFNATYRKHVESFDAVVAMTPDLCFDWLQSTFIPHSIDADLYPFSWADGKLAMQTPSTPARKGTELFVEACQNLAASHGIDYKIITGTSHEYVMQQKRKATIFFDQAGREREDLGGHYIGWYGNSALEAAVYGVPTMAYLSNEAFDRAERAGRRIRQQCGMLNVQPSVESMQTVMADFFRSSPEARLAVARRARQWIEDFHSQQATGAMLSALYDRF